MVTSMKPGDTFTIAGVYPAFRRRWWQFWRPRLRPDKSRLQVFRIAGDYSAKAPDQP
jgi:hypothetical protein